MMCIIQLYSVIFVAFVFKLILDWVTISMNIIIVTTVRDVQ